MKAIEIRTIATAIWLATPDVCKHCGQDKKNGLHQPSTECTRCSAPGEHHEFAQSSVTEINSDRLVNTIADALGLWGRDRTEFIAKATGQPTLSLRGSGRDERKKRVRVRG